MTRRTFLKSLGVVGAGVAAGLSMLPSPSGSTGEFAYVLKPYRGRGPKVCIKTCRSNFANEYATAIKALNRNIAAIVDEDLRGTYRLLSDPRPPRFYLIDGEWRRAEWA